MMTIKNAPLESCVGLLPAAGKGERLGVPFPKELFPIIINNQYMPVSSFSLTNLVNSDISNIVFVINETKQELIKYYGNGNRFNCQISYVVQEETYRDKKAKSPGLAHALDSAYYQIKNKFVFFCMPDTIIFPEDFLSKAKRFSPEDADLTLCLFPTARPEKYGMVELSQNNQIKNIIDKPSTTNLNLMWGSIIWSPAFSDFLHEQVNEFGLSDFAEILNKAISEGLKLFGYQVNGGSYFDIGTPNEVYDVYNFLH